MDREELLKEIKLIEVKTNKIVKEVFSGEYHSIFKGNGMEFEDIREYYPGDDVRNIDWKVSARQGRAFIKKYKEERELDLYLLVDISGSAAYGKKSAIIARIAASLAFSAEKNSDKVGCILFSDKVERHIPSKKGKKHILSIVETILTTGVGKGKTNISEAIRYFKNIEKKRSILFIISDFLDKGFIDDVKSLYSKHDVILIRVIEKSEEKLPKGAIFLLEDMESGEKLYLDNSRKELEITNNMEKLPTRNLINIYTDKDYIKPIMYFFKRRMRR